MNSNKKPAKGVTTPVTSVNRQAGPFKPVVAQLKTRASAPGAKQPVAPPVYKPQHKKPQIGLKPQIGSKPGTKAIQPKMANGVVSRKPPVAPPAYRPQQTPKVLQRKTAPGALLRPVPNIASKTIQRTPEESKNLKMLGLMWNKYAESDKTSKAKAKFFEHIKEIKDKLNFNVYTVWHKHDLYVGGGKNKNYVKIVEALKGADAGKAAADAYIDWAEGSTSITALSHALQELVLIVHIAEVGRMYIKAPETVLAFMKMVSAASKPERLELWKNFKEYNEFAFTAKEDPEYLPDASEMSDDD